MLASIVENAGVVTVNATAQDDTIVISSATPGFTNISINYDQPDAVFGSFASSDVQNVVVFAGDGNDRVFNSATFPTEINGQAGNDILNGGSSNDIIHGGFGEDIINGRLGDDLIVGGADRDRLSGADGADIILGQDGDDVINGHGGDDFIDAGGGNDVIVGGNGNDTIYGQQGDDNMSGNAGEDFLHGGEGNDRIDGGTGDDFLAGREGDDSLFGEGGDDNLNGSTGDDFLVGGTGNDSLDGMEGLDQLFGGGGNDYLEGGFDADTDQLNGGSGSDEFIQRDNDVLQDVSSAQLDTVVQGSVPRGGSTGTASIGDFVFEDENGNGDHDPGEIGVEGVSVLLNSSGNQMAQTVTDSNGGYVFEELQAGDYTVVVDLSNSPGYSPSVTSSLDVSLADGESNEEIDFGLIESDTTGPSASFQLAEAFAIPASGVQLQAFASFYGTEVEPFGDFSIVDTGATKYIFSSISVGFGTANKLRGSFPSSYPDAFVDQIIGPTTVANTIHVTNPSGNTENVVGLAPDGEILRLGEVVDSPSGPLYQPSASTPVLDETEKTRISFDIVEEPNNESELGSFVGLFPALSSMTFLLVYDGGSGFDLATVEGRASGLGFSAAEVTELKASIAADRDLKNAFSGQPADIDANLQIWKAIKDNPGLYWEIRNELDQKNNPTANPGDNTSLFDGLVQNTNNGDEVPTPLSADEIKRWKTWAGRRWFKQNTARGKTFEGVVVQNLNGTATNNKLNSALTNAEIDVAMPYQLYLNVYLEFPEPKPLTNGKVITYFIADQVISQGDKFVIVEDKLSNSTNLTANQNHALRNVTSFKVVTQREDRNSDGEPLLPDTTIANPQWVKTWDNTEGTAIEGAANWNSTTQKFIAVN